MWEKSHNVRKILIYSCHKNNNVPKPRHKKVVIDEPSIKMNMRINGWMYLYLCKTCLDRLPLHQDKEQAVLRRPGKQDVKNKLAHCFQEQNTNTGINICLLES